MALDVGFEDRGAMHEPVDRWLDQGANVILIGNPAPARVTWVPAAARAGTERKIGWPRGAEPRRDGG